MNSQNYATVIRVDATPEEAFAGITSVRDWWSGEIGGDTDRIGAQFTYTYPNVHWCKIEITELVPGRRIAWRVLDSDIKYVTKTTEWNGTTITFDLSTKDGRTEVRFEHAGLVPDFECFDSCSNGWSALVNGNLRERISTGQPQPDPFAARA